MKKWILNLGLTTLAVLPIVAVASCSSTTGTTSALATEVAKFEKSFELKEETKDTTIVSANNLITSAGSAQEKWDALGMLVNLPAKSNGFAYDIKSSSIDSTTSSLKVVITITEIVNDESKNIDLTVTGFKTTTSQDLNAEVAKFEKSFELKDGSKDTDINSANNLINSAQGSQAKWDALGTLIDLPAKSTGFTYDVKSSLINSATSSLKVSISITQVSNKESRNLFMTITGFKATTSPALVAEVEKYKNPFSVKESVKTMTAFSAIENINKASETTKMTVLGTLIALPQTNSAFAYKVGVARPITGDEKSLIVPLTITEIATPTISQTVEIKITGLATSSEFEQEIAKFQISLPANDASKAKETTTVEREISNSSDRERTLRGIVDNLPTVSRGYRLRIGNASLSSTSITSVNVSITVIREVDSTSKSTNLVITGLKQETSLLTAEARKFTTSLATTWKVNAAAAVKTINETVGNQAKIDLLKQHVPNFPTVSSGFSLTVGQAEPVANPLSSITVALRVIRNIDSEPKDATLTITGLSLPQDAINAELAKLSNKKVIANKAKETASQAAAAIKDNATLKSYYAQVTLSPGFSYTWKSDEAVGDTVKVTVVVSSTQPGITPVDHNFIISGFASQLDFEAAKFAKNITTTNGSNTPTQVINGINSASGQPAKLAKLKSYVVLSEFPTLDSKFTFEVGLASANATFGNAANVAIKVIETSTKKEKTVTLTIVGLTAELS